MVQSRLGFTTVFVSCNLIKKNMLLLNIIQGEHLAQFVISVTINGTYIHSHNYIYRHSHSFLLVLFMDGLTEIHAHTHIQTYTHNTHTNSHT
jgi:hypothetical protein